MEKISSLNDLQNLKTEIVNEIHAARDRKVLVRVAMATCGIASGAKDVHDYLISEFDKRAIDAIVVKTGCMGYCYAEPTIEVTRPGDEPVVFGFVDIRKADQVIELFVRQGQMPDGVIPVNYDTI
jgi:NADP-reducing hydrogenase subunit HndB